MCLLWMLAGVGADLVDDPDFEQLRRFPLGETEREQWIADAKHRLHAARPGVGQLGEKYPELRARIQSGVWPTRAEVWS